MATDSKPTVYDMLNDAPDYATGVADLFVWSENHDWPRPSALFLDIIGYSDEEYDEPMFDLNKVTERFGYMEIGKLADALKEYAERPQDVREWVNTLMEAESRE